MPRTNIEDIIEKASSLGLKVDDTGRVEEPGYRIDKKDNRLVRFSPFPQYEIKENTVIETTGGEFLIFLRPIEYSQKIETQEDQDMEIVKVKDLRDSKIRRDSIVQIFHYADKETHDLSFVVDMENQQYQGELISFHLNPKGESEHIIRSEDCQECRKHFGFLDHMEISFEEGMKGFYKFPDWNETIGRIENKIRDNLSEKYELR